MIKGTTGSSFATTYNIPRYPQLETALPFNPADLTALTQVKLSFDSACQITFTPLWMRRLRVSAARVGYADVIIINLKPPNEVRNAIS